MLAQLQRADVGHNCPPVARRNLLLVIRHRSISACYHIEDVAHRYPAKPVDMVRRRLSVAAQNDRSMACAQRVMTYCAIDRVTCLSAFEDALGDRERKCIDVVTFLEGQDACSVKWLPGYPANQARQK